jgi:ubiquinone/menaquinone biosynthesis C-methylase UbiE
MTILPTEFDICPGPGYVDGIETGVRKMKTLEESVAQAMDGSDTRIVPFLPYILQDAWEIGTPAEMVVDLVRRHTRDHSRLSVLDLGCGKGAVAVKLAAELGCRCLGVDAVKEFIDYARGKAAEWGVSDLCRFETGDIRERIVSLGRFDVVVLGAIGPVFGDYRTTLATVSPHLRQGGVVVVDDGFIPDDSPYSHPLVLKRSDMLRQVEEAGLHLAEEVPVGSDEIRDTSEVIFRDLKRRCEELMAMYPEKRGLFEDYIRRQVEENDVLRNKVVCVVMVISKD